MRVSTSPRAGTSGGERRGAEGEGGPRKRLELESRATAHAGLRDPLPFLCVSWKEAQPAKLLDPACQPPRPRLLPIALDPLSSLPRNALPVPRNSALHLSPPRAHTRSTPRSPHLRATAAIPSGNPRPKAYLLRHHSQGGTRSGALLLSPRLRFRRLAQNLISGGAARPPSRGMCIRPISCLSSDPLASHPQASCPGVLPL